ncbi:group 1 truncated hemoglobin [Alteromonas sp. ASW11-36]|uniref:Group 1 truncated hemoglobin n=1 Tax=Alteromonas arenosi TaxID=3055817 RepID=A0ABT7SWI3_9ALTE|nr:group 1 truncated hemoglobin [Alteromonas sp. ASW11-36]MDM7860546.1 group 1 truncated hemoglobin [Alteromonas sp. ASW11-36]
MRILSFILLVALMSGCALNQTTVFEQLGGHSKVNEIVENFVIEIERDPVILAYFEGANIDRFVTKLSEQICQRTGGPCEYTGDTMEQVHAGMNITEADFNRTVDLLINAMNRADVPHTLQNQVLNALAPTRKEMLYL